MIRNPNQVVIKILSLVTVNYAWEFQQNVQIGKSKWGYESI